ncbi:MAG TPA: Lrp/AsnC family transcriptional regulator [Streptosporangiaceae bacterium]|nr:Lrp/AsnC family transcriptional regulator [Actinomycetes bacterium]HXA62400.1 Lrp/AsnC family transcriptional regulator [Streptosporangiaceae bacterium]
MIALDDLDRTILKEMQSDGRISYAALGERIGLSAPATRQRVQRLLDAGVLQVVGVTDPLALGWPMMAMIGIHADGDVRRVADVVGSLPQVIYVVLTSGGYDLFAEVVCRSPQELLDLVEDSLKPIEGVSKVEPFIYYGIHTHRFTWDIP